VGDLAIVNMETNSDLLLFHNLVCNSNMPIMRVELETMLGEDLHKLLVVRLLELSKTGMYVTYPYLESHESREPVPS
jgi:hypothetical protein